MNLILSKITTNKSGANEIMLAPISYIGEIIDEESDDDYLTSIVNKLIRNSRSDKNFLTRVMKDLSLDKKIILNEKGVFSNTDKEVIPQVITIREYENENILYDKLLNDGIDTLYKENTVIVFNYNEDLESLSYTLIIIDEDEDGEESFIIDTFKNLKYLLERYEDLNEETEEDFEE